MYGYYGLESDPCTAAVWHLDNSLECSTPANSPKYDFNGITGGAEFIDNGRFNQGVSVPGGGGHVEMNITAEPNDTTYNWLGCLMANEFSFETWFRPQVQQNPYATLACAWANDGFSIAYSAEGDKIDAYINLDTQPQAVGAVLYGQTVIDPNEWHHVAITRHNGTGVMTLYVDGRIESSYPAEPGVPLKNGWTSGDYGWGLNLGLHTWGNNPSACDFDEARLSHVARSFTLVGVDCINFLDADISGPDDRPDCHVNLIDFAKLASQWLHCTEARDPACQ